MLVIISYTMLSREVPDHTLEAIHQFLASVVESEKSKEKRACRGPFLAQLEFDKLCKECKYTRQSKFCCFEQMLKQLIQ